MDMKLHLQAMLHNLLALDTLQLVCVYLRITSAYITTPVEGDGESSEVEKRYMSK